MDHAIAFLELKQIVNIVIERKLEYRTNFSVLAPSARGDSGLTSDEVLLCSYILTFARTYFARAERVVA